MSTAARLETAEETIARLEGERDAAEREASRVRLGLASGDRTLEVAQVYEYWRLRCRPRVRQLGEKRGAAVRARLSDGYSVQELMRAVDGARFGAFVTPEGVRMDDLELICRDDSKLGAFLARWEGPMTRGRLKPLLDAYCLPDQGPGACAVLDPLEQAYRYKCPVCRVGWDRADYLPLLAAPGVMFCGAGCVWLDPVDAARVVREALLADFPLVP